MKVCIFGAGAVGGVFGALLTRAGVDVTLVARGAHLEAMRSKGLTVVSPEESFTVKPRCSDDPQEIGPQDYVIATLKAHSLGPALPALLPLLGPGTALVSAQNGIPWWYGYKLGGPFDGRQLESVDAGGAIWRNVTPQRAIGAVVWQAAALLEPGVVEIGRIGRLTLGEPDGSASDVDRTTGFARGGRRPDGPSEGSMGGRGRGLRAPPRAVHGPRRVGPGNRPGPSRGVS